MRALLYVTAVHKMSCSGSPIVTIEHRNIHKGCSTVLTEFMSVIVWFFSVWLSAMETGSVSGRQMEERY